MREMLTPQGYEQTQAKLRDLQVRLAEVGNRRDLNPSTWQACVAPTR
jgi:hypothetical protein